jgi:hypothetical protein
MFVCCGVWSIHLHSAKIGRLSSYAYKMGWWSIIGAFTLCFLMHIFGDIGESWRWNCIVGTITQCRIDYIEQTQAFTHRFDILARV